MFKPRRRVKEDAAVEESPTLVASDTDEEEERKPAFSAAALQSKVHKLLKFSTFEPEHRYWLDTGSPELNAVFGSRDKGIPYGKILELSGAEHGGKTLLSLIVGGMAQADGAFVGRIDLEDSRDAPWDRKFKLNPESIYDIYPRLVVPKAKRDDGEDEPKKKGKKKKGIGGTPRLQSAEELFQEAEVTMALAAEQGFKKQFWFLDSVANIMTDMAVEAGAERNMRVNLDRAMFLSMTLPKWAALAANYNATIFLINQLRDRPNVMFGDPSYSPGGRALRHACAIRARVRRKKELSKAGEVIGLLGLIQNTKNKAGAGSIQNAKCGFKVKWNKPVALVEFMSAEDLGDLVKG